MPKYAITRILPYPAEPLFEIAADVERYPDFVPWWVAARVRDRDGRVYRTEQVVGFGPLRERFSSRTVLDPPRRIEITSADRRFRTFRLAWGFEPLAGESCRVSFEAALDFRSPARRGVFALIGARFFEDVVDAFAARARALHGRSGARAGAGEIPQP